MIPDKQSRTIIDYALETQVLYRKVASTIITEEKDLTLLCEKKTYCEMDAEGNTSASTLFSSSWTPEWLVTNTPDKYRIDQHGESPGSCCLNKVGEYIIKGSVLVTQHLS
jgi:hypothetical protein